MCGYRVVEVNLTPRRSRCFESAKNHGPQTAGLMKTNQYTGAFEEDIVEIADIVHQAGSIIL